MSDFIACEEQRRVHGMLQDAKERSLRLRVAKVNAWGELEMKRAEARAALTAGMRGET